jgi:hypothetical protein
MQIICHRINTLEQLSQLKASDGAEVDVRYHLDDLILHHDPFQHYANNSLQLESFLKSWYCKGPLILNLKSEGIEAKCIDLMTKYNISNWFFLDMSMPFFVNHSIQSELRSIEGFGPENLAVRFSDFEPIDYAIAFKHRVNWVWVDTFRDFPLSVEKYTELKEAGFKICLVSPELQGFPKEEINNIKNKIQGFDVEAVCTKHPKLWS